jgi:hypothetical protein
MFAVKPSTGYYSQYIAKRKECALHERLLTDRDAYLAHLEEQLEKVAAACLLAEDLKGGHERLESRVKRTLECASHRIYGLRSTSGIAVGPLG